MAWTRELIVGGLIAILLGGFIVGFERAGVSSNLLMSVSGWLLSLLGCAALVTGIVRVAQTSSQQPSERIEPGADEEDRTPT